MSAIVDRITDAYAGVMNPRAIDATHFTNCAIVTGVVFGLIGVFHFLVAARFKRPYFVLHVAVNAVVSAIVFKGSVRSLLNPTASTVPLSSESANAHLYLCWVFALHVYHPIFFRTGVMDWIHHIPVYILNILIFACHFGDVFCLQTIILTGVPGGIDYLLLAIEGEGLITRATYKDLSAYINNWVRAPLGFLSGYICLLGVYHQYDQEPNPPSTYQVIVFIFMGIHAMWNTPYFGRQAIEANVVDVINRFGLQGNDQDRKKAIKLPQVRALSGKLDKKSAGDKRK